MPTHAHASYVYGPYVREKNFAQYIICTIRAEHWTNRGHKLWYYTQRARTHQHRTIGIDLFFVLLIVFTAFRCILNVKEFRMPWNPIDQWSSTGVSRDDAR